MATLTQQPTLCIPTREAKAVLNLQQSGANYVRLWITNAPPESELKKKLDESGESRNVVYNGGGGAGEPYKFTPDKPGAYVFKAQEYTRGSDYGGGYKGDPNAEVGLTPLSTESTLTFSVAEKLKQRVGLGADSSDLIVYMSGVRIAATNIAEHGEKTPRLEGAATARGKIAEVSCDSELASLDGHLVVTLYSSLAFIINEMIDEFNDHREQGTIHGGLDDTDNVIDEDYRTPATQDGFIRSTNELLLKARRHFLNDDGAAVSAAGGVGSAAYHSAADWTNLPAYQSVGDMAQVCSALADFWRAYEAHRASATLHTSADSTNTLSTMGSILLLHKAYMTSVHSNNPSAPETAHAGSVMLKCNAGFTEA